MARPGSFRDREQTLKHQRKRDLPQKLRRSETDRDRSPPFGPPLWMIINGAAFQRCTVACWVAGKAPHPSLLTLAFIWLAPCEALSSQLVAEEVKERGGVKSEQEMKEKRILEDEHWWASSVVLWSKINSYIETVMWSKSKQNIIQPNSRKFSWAFPLHYGSQLYLRQHSWPVVVNYSQKLVD